MGAELTGLQPMDTAATTGHRGREREKDCCCLRSGSGQWAAMVRALELCRTQPSACPTSTPRLIHQLKVRGPGGPWGEDQLLTSLSAPRMIDSRLLVEWYF